MTVAQRLLLSASSIAVLAWAPFIGMALAERENARDVDPDDAGTAQEARASDGGTVRRSQFASALAPDSVATEATDRTGVGQQLQYARASALSYIAVLLPPQMANLSPRIEARVFDVPVKVGQPVRKGDVVVSFDLRLSKRDLVIAQAQLREARAEATSASYDLAAARSRASRRSGAVEIAGQSVPLVAGEEAAQSRFDAQNAAAKVALGSARVAEMQGKVEQLELAVHESELRAPFDGVVAAVNFEPGSTAHVGDIVARVIGGRGLRLRMAVPDDGAAALQGAERARFEIDGRTFFARLEQVPPEPDPASRSFVVEGAVEDFAVLCQDGCPDLVGRTIQATLVPTDQEKVTR